MLPERLVSPPMTELTTFRQKLTAGELKVLDLFSQTLPVGWEIYIQPHLNGLRPDFVLLNPSVGIAVFEVKDWNLDAMRYFTQKDELGRDELWAERDGNQFCIQKENPVAKVDRYKKEIFDLYCPRLMQGNGWAAISAGVIFPFADSRRARALLDPFLSVTDDDPFGRYQPISGMHEIAAGDIGAVFPESSRKTSFLMSGDRAKDLRGWLVEPDFSVTQRRPLVLDKNQRALSETRTDNGYRRIKGPAGSGKSLVLAARAAQLANEGKSVLVATYNITLWHYLRDLIVRGLSGPSRLQNIQFTNFHHWCKEVCYDVGWKNRYDALWEHETDTDQILDVSMPRLALEAVTHPDAKKYDAILVDEGQDYRPLWWNVLRKACKPDGEMLLVADATQDVYDTARAWTDEVMAGAGFPGGRWAQLKTSYRLPQQALKLSRSFAETFLPSDALDLPELTDDELDLDSCHLKWVQCDPDGAVRACSDAVLSMMRQTGKIGLANADITVLASDMKSGAAVVDQLATYRVRAVETFGDDHRRKKVGFFMGDARVKATTLHSFKGWETPLLVLFITGASHAKDLALTYAGLTRLKRSQHGSWLTVVCQAPELQKFGESFPEYLDLTDSKMLEDESERWPYGAPSTGEHRPNPPL